ncbi:hypothetical protein FVE85_3951 [Porphyridium purpureum]|uniref:Uncharacterized protein n=1 Tax=Porphyridium purpureum TaxID=35688 RepID=A0A5J4YRP6_PORPP|nr:hypothetical protein FVE85_3951 [Porphyridium purpureum]|eukprot:POR4814..scf229_5
MDKARRQRRPWALFAGMATVGVIVSHFIAEYRMPRAPPPALPVQQQQERRPRQLETRASLEQADKAAAVAADAGADSAALTDTAQQQQRADNMMQMILETRAEVALAEARRRLAEAEQAGVEEAHGTMELAAPSNRARDMLFESDGKVKRRFHS